MAVTKQQCLDLFKRRYKSVDVPGLGQFRLQSLKNSEMRKLRQLMLTKDGDANPDRMTRLQDLLVGTCLVDDEGNRLFSDAEILDGVLDEIDGLYVSWLFSECKDWTGYARDPDWKAIEGAAKNYESTSSHSSTTGSPNGSGIVR